jgi:hypothetical protein
MPSSVRFLVIPHIQPRPENSHSNNNGFYMIPNSSNQRVRQQVQIYLFNNVSKHIKVMRVKWCSLSRWMIFLTLTIDERPLQGEEQALEMFTQTETTSYETPNGWRIKKFIPHVSRRPQEENYDMYMHNFGIAIGIANGIIIEHNDDSRGRLVEESRGRLVEESRVRLDDEDSIHSESIEERLAQDRINEARTSINTRNRVDIFAIVVGIPVREVN